MNMELWNKAAISKLLWDVAFKFDKLWVKWVNAYYIKRLDINTVAISANSSWLLRKIIDCRGLLNVIGGVLLLLLKTNSASKRLIIFFWVIFLELNGKD